MQKLEVIKQTIKLPYDNSNNQLRICALGEFRIFKLKREQTFTLHVEVQADTTTITSYLRLGVDHSHQRLPSIRWTRRRCKPPSCATYGFSCEAEG